MWTVIYMSKDEKCAEVLKNALSEKSIISMIRENDGYFEILVPAAEMNVAHGIIIDTEI